MTLSFCLGCISKIDEVEERKDRQFGFGHNDRSLTVCDVLGCAIGIVARGAADGSRAGNVLYC